MEQMAGVRYAVFIPHCLECSMTVERQDPAEIPLQRDAEFHFAADRTSVGSRRLLKNMGLTFAEGTRPRELG